MRVIYCCQSFDPCSLMGFPVKLQHRNKTLHLRLARTHRDENLGGTKTKNCSYIYRLTDVFSVKTKSIDMFYIVSTATELMWTLGLCASLKEALLWIPNV